MKVHLQYQNKTYTADLGQPKDISTPLRNDSTLNCYNAPPFLSEPVIHGDFIGSISKGSVVNFYNLHINPHGNGTHTECLGHITKGNYFINRLLKEFHFIVRLVSLMPRKNGSDFIIEKEQLEGLEDYPSGLIIRTLPNGEDKLSKNYSDTNPPYFDADVFRFLKEKGVEHILTDLPSVDKEKDGGKLSAHKEFWGIDQAIRPHATITELVYVDNEIKDGLYLLNLQVMNIEVDASPSRPLLFTIERLHDL